MFSKTRSKPLMASLEPSDPSSVLSWYVLSLKELVRLGGTGAVLLRGPLLLSCTIVDFATGTPCFV